MFVQCDQNLPDIPQVYCGRFTHQSSHLSKSCGCFGVRSGVSGLSGRLCAIFGLNFVRLNKLVDPIFSVFAVAAFIPDRTVSAASVWSPGYATENLAVCAELARRIENFG